MNVVDSSGWLAYFADDENADFFAEAIEDSAQLLVPVIVIYEVYKRVLQQRGLELAHDAVADLYSGTVVAVDEMLALSAAKISVETKLAMADSMMLATARAHDAVLWTQDADFAGLDGVKYREK
ncbi:MAG: type II toxin-antitoxin system VapC family toxin [Anaerolineaceae bacterium]|nr:type II toxin-antitoxin system VapC family toxin [Anaerolineaceae bacterium]